MSHTQSLIGALTEEMEGLRHQALESADTLRDRLKSEPLIQNGLRTRMLAMVDGHEKMAEHCVQFLQTLHRDYGGASGK